MKIGCRIVKPTDVNAAIARSIGVNALEIAPDASCCGVTFLNKTSSQALVMSLIQATNVVFLEMVPIDPTTEVAVELAEIDTFTVVLNIKDVERVQESHVF